MSKIFYVEDEPFLAKIVKETLEKNDYDVSLFSSGTKAAEAFDSGLYDICVLDIMLPGINGFDLAKKIKSKEPHIPILFLTAKDQTEDVIKGFKSGGNEYIKKPFSIEELIVRVQNLITLTKEKSESITIAKELSIGAHFRFDQNKQRLTYKQDRQRLSYKESQLLGMLCSEINEPVDRKEILMRIWQDDSFYNSRNLDVYITKLRKHLKKDPSINLITLKGVGYRLSTEN